jgi:hypothetical protein
MVFRSGRAAIAVYYRPKFAAAVPTIGRQDDSFVAFPYLFDENDAQLVRDHLAPNTELAAYLSHWHFDPPQDHPPGPEFTWSPILVNDFSDVNDDVGTCAGVSEGHFSSLVQWQPQVDNTKTRLIAIVAPGPFGRTLVAESDSLPVLGQKLVDAGYSAVGIHCKAGGDEEFADAASYATRLEEASGLVPLHVAREERDISGTPFRLSIREIWSVAEA